MKKLFGFVILFALFVPLERVYPLKRDQKVFREGFKTDLVHFFVNEILVKIGMFFVAPSNEAKIRSRKTDDRGEGEAVSSGGT